MDMDLLTALAEAGGPPGREERVRAVVEPELAALCDRVERDPLGRPDRRPRARASRA